MQQIERLDDRYADRAAVEWSSSLLSNVGMEDAKDIVAKVLEQLSLTQNAFAPKRRFWLTLYLDGSPTAYVPTKKQLHALGWVKLCEHDDFAGFAYPKKGILNTLSEICEALNDALYVCKDTGMNVGLIDADTSFEPANSSFYNLYKQI